MNNNIQHGKHFIPYAIQFASKEEMEAFAKGLDEIGYEKVSTARSLLMLVTPELKRYGFHTKAVNFSKREGKVYMLKEAKDKI